MIDKWRGQYKNYVSPYLKTHDKYKSNRCTKRINIHKPNSCNNNKLKRHQQLLNQLIENNKEQKLLHFII
jgi:hypothetical protein